VLKDPFGRPVSNIRISVTPRCNLHCIYCHREGEVGQDGLISVDDITAILTAGTQFGIRSAKFTGGEPLLRTDLCEIVSAVPAGMECSLTTNGTLLADLAWDLKNAGLSRVNVSLDSLHPTTYRAISGSDRLNDVLAGIDAALDAGLSPVKINMVVLGGINEDEVDDFLTYVRGDRHLVLQLIELMDRPDCHYHFNLTPLEGALAAHSKEIFTRRMHHRRKYCLDGAEVEVVRPLHNSEFCAHCNRLRVTSDGKLKPCLLRSDNHISILGKRGEELDDLIKKAVALRAPFYT
jgi:cyclic pyranopterin phosphate synthase